MVWKESVRCIRCKLSLVKKSFTLSPLLLSVIQRQCPPRPHQTTCDIPIPTCPGSPHPTTLPQHVLPLQVCCEVCCAQYAQGGVNLSILHISKFPNYDISLRNLC